MSRFCLTLPSNSSTQYYPENTVACYTTKLANMIELKGDWEVGLLEISTPKDLVNVADGRCFYIIYVDRKYYRKIRMPSANYPRIQLLIDALHEEQRKQVTLVSDESLYVRFSTRLNKVRIHLDPTGAYGDVAVRFSEDLANLLGFESGERYASDKSAPHPYSLSLDSVDNMYVYCDLLEHVVVGDTKAPLLRIANKTVRLYGIVHKIFNPVMYVPLQKKNFDTVEINIMDDAGKPIPFRSGKTKSLVVLEFRRSIHPYFAL